MNNYEFTQLKNVYPSINEYILDKGFSLEKEHMKVTTDQLKIIKHWWKYLPLKKETTSLNNGTEKI